jgi:gliding motility-associated-like protein
VTFTDTIHTILTPIAEFEARPAVTTSDLPKVDFTDESQYATGWKWRFGDPFTGNDNKSILQNPFHVYSDTGKFTVILIADYQGLCSDTVTHYVRVNDAYAFFIPNAFSPNDDGRNDVFLPVGMGTNTGEFEMHIFDRWGRKVFNTTNQNEGWDGADSYSGNVCAQGVYTYIINIKEISGVKHRYIGLITLII